MSTILYVLLAILLLGILIAIHEFGHFATARLTKIPVREFAIGMGPKLWSRTGKKSGTVYSLRAVPMGGFCSFIGEDDVQQVSKDDPRCWAKQKLWRRFLVVLMGPGMNFVLAFVVLFFYMAIGEKTVPTMRPVIGAVVEGSPAEEAGLLAGDNIVDINGVSTLVTSILPFEYTEPVDRMIRGWRDGDAPLRVTVLRDDAQEELEITPRYYPDEKRNLIGISYGSDPVEIEERCLSIGESVSYAWRSFRYYSTAIFDAVIGLFKGQNLDQVSGPVGAVAGITDMVKSAQEEWNGGFSVFVELLALISVNLGIMNLLPIPGLDGSRLVFMIIEGIRGKPVPPEKEAMVHLVGIAVLFALMIFLTFRDVSALFRK